MENMTMKQTRLVHVPSVWIAVIAIGVPTTTAAAKPPPSPHTSPVLAQVEHHFFNGKDFKGGQVVIPKSVADNPDTKRWVVVDVHGAGGPEKNWFGYRLLKTFGQDRVIALAPVFGEGYHLGEGEDRALLRCAAERKKQAPQATTIRVDERSVFAKVLPISETAMRYR